MENSRHTEPQRARQHQHVVLSLLAPHDLDIVSTGLRRIYPPEECICFEDLLIALDEADEHRWTPDPAAVVH